MKNIKTEIQKEFKKMVVSKIQKSKEFNKMDKCDQIEFNDWLNSLSEEYQFSNEIDTIMNTIENLINKLSDESAKTLIDKNL